MAELVGKNESYAGRRLHLPDQGGVVGRDPRNHLVVTHESVSSLHALLRVEGGALFIRDQQSTNGTRLNGVEVSDAQIQDGDELEIGNILFTVSAPEYRRRDAPDAPVPPAAIPPSAAPGHPPPAPKPAEAFGAGEGFLQRPSPVNTGIGVALAVALLALLVRYLSLLGP